MIAPFRIPERIEISMKGSDGVRLTASIHSDASIDDQLDVIKGMMISLGWTEQLFDNAILELADSIQNVRSIENAKEDEE